MNESPLASAPTSSVASASTASRRFDGMLERPVSVSVGQSSLRSVLGRFAFAFDRATQPLLGPLHRVEAALEEAGQTPALTLLRELTHQVASLRDRVAQQQAYVLIFGPLKSGKSTFMNAIAASYVSEVTALPAYPCMVHVRHADTTAFTLHRYDNTRQTLTGRADVVALLDAAHRELTQRIREVEQVGRTFDPAADMPGAIRRIDVATPAADLAPSCAVLVDTPGLYTRMKFGYDRMTRDFRDAAACAIFIVKTDNLFLEQVFNEFQELLQLFGRIFLIVNLDSSKRDLKPDGTLGPSLEYEDPQRIVEAFKTLTMNPAIRTALEEGRLGLYPVDLLTAASERMRGGPDRQALGFSNLLTDLTEYLNSNDYLRTFMLDSLRRAHTLVEELTAVAEHEQVHALRSRAQQVRSELERARESAEAVARLSATNWLATLEGLHEAIAQTARDHVAAEHERFAQRTTDAVSGWFDSDEGLASLHHERLGPVLIDARRSWLGVVERQLAQRVTSDHAIASLGEARLRDFERTGIDPRQLAADALHHADTPSALPADPPAIAPQDIPVRKTFWDYLLLRTTTSIRRRLFGRDGAGGRPIARSVKQRRLGDPARDRITRHSRDRLDTLRGDAIERLPRHAYEGYAKAYQLRIRQSLTARQQELDQRMESLRLELDTLDAVLEAVHDLTQEQARTRAQLSAIQVDALPHA